MAKLDRPESLGRRVAYDVLLRVLRGGAWAGLTLDVALKERPYMDKRERALATELVYGTLRRTPALDEALSAHSKRALETLDDRVLVLLRLGAHQLLDMRIPDHAAVGETVELARAVGASSAAGFVNAVLRSLGRAGPPRPPPLDENPCANLLLTEGLPAWLCEQWQRELPAEELEPAARANNQPAQVTLRAASRVERDGALERLRESGVEASATRLSSVGVRLDEGLHPESLPLWSELRLQAQDEGAQVVTEYALLPGVDPAGGEARRPRPAEILDACAAPGGKTCHLAQALPEARIVAVDLHRRRIERVAAEAARLGLAERIDARAADSTKPLPFARPEGFDLVLLDAPCTGLGTLRRHPEIKLRRSADDVARLAGLQDDLLRNLAGYVSAGGLLVYAVCTTTPEEGPLAVERFLSSHPTFRLEAPQLPEEAVDESSSSWQSFIEERGMLRLWTHRHGTDGFFAARLRRSP